MCSQSLARVAVVTVLYRSHTAETQSSIRWGGGQLLRTGHQVSLTARRRSPEGSAEGPEQQRGVTSALASFPPQVQPQHMSGLALGFDLGPEGESA